MASAPPIWAQVHTVDAAGVTTFTNDVIIGGKVLESPLISKIVGGATSFSIRNHADTRDNLIVQDSGTFVHATSITGASASQTYLGTANLSFASLSADYAGVIAAFDGATTTDTGAFNYTGKLRGVMGHVNIQSVGATLAKVEAVAGVVIATAASTGTLSDGYGVSGEILHSSTSLTITAIRGVTGTVQILSSGNVGTAYGSDNGVVTTLGQTGTITTQADGSRNYVSVASTVTVGAMTGAENFVQFTAAGTVTGDAVGAFNYFQNGSATATVSGNVYGAHDEVLLSGAVVTSGGVYGTFSHIFVQGTGLGGTTNAALNAEIQWGSSSNPSGSCYAGQFRYRVSAAAVVAVGAGVFVNSPVIANSGTFTAGYGVRVANQGNAGITTSSAIRIDNQTGSGTNYAINSLGGIISLASTGGSALVSSASNSLTLSTTTSGTLFLTSAGSITHTSVLGATWTHSGGPWALNSTSQSITLATITSGTIAATSAGLLNLTGVGASQWTPGAGSAIVSDTVSGITVATGATQKLGFYGATPVVQPAASADVTGFVAGAGTASKSDSTWAGASGASAYTVGGIVTRLKALGLLAP